jgi:hypothetical protein
MAKDKDDATSDTNQASASEMDESEIDDNLRDTFPASDPPSWTLGSNHRSDSKQEQGSSDVEDD